MSHARGKKRKGRPVDMSVPPELRVRKRRQQVVGGTPPAQLGHATSGTARRQRRHGERWLAAESQLRQAGAGEDTDDGLEQWSA